MCSNRTSATSPMTLETDARIRFDLPWPHRATANSSWRSSVSRRGRVVVFLSRSAREYRRTVTVLLLAQRVSRLMLAEPVAVDFLALPPITARAFDLDNLLKPALDALVHAGILMDDRFVDEITICRGPRDGAGRLVVTLRKPREVMGVRKAL